MSGRRKEFTRGGGKGLKEEEGEKIREGRRKEEVGEEKGEIASSEDGRI